MAAGDYVLRLAHLTGMGMSDINADDAVQTMAPGTLCFVRDAFGYKVLRYCRFVNAMLQGELASRYGSINGVTVITNLDSGSTTTALKAAGWTADAEVGALFYVHDDAGAAGAAPEGEVSLVAKNTAGQITLDASLPLSAALAVNDDVTTVAMYQVEDSTDGDLNVTVMGVVLGAQGVAINNFGWVQMEGVVKAKATAASITAFNPVVAGANLVAAFGTDGQELWIGTSLATYTSDNVAATLPVRLQLFSSAGVGTAP